MTNCLLYALALRWRRFWRGAHCGITWRWSHWGRFPHFIFVEIRRGQRRQISYKPLAPKRKRVPPLWFKGYVAWGDVPPDFKQKDSK